MSDVWYSANRMLPAGNDVPVMVSDGDMAVAPAWWREGKFYGFSTPTDVITWVKLWRFFPSPSEGI